MNTDQGVSIIVLTRNGEHDIHRLLQTFLQKNTCSPVEFIIVDHSPQKDISDVMGKYAKDVFIRYIKRGRNFSFAESNNFAAGKSRFPCLLFLNPVTGAFLLCQKSDFDAAGGFCKEHDEGFEDIDFCKLLESKLNRKCYCVNDAYLLHKDENKEAFKRSMEKITALLMNDLAGKSPALPSPTIQPSSIVYKKSVLGFDNEWQFPAVTEKHAFLKACELLPNVSGMIYFGFPWATLIDQLHNKVGNAKELKNTLYDFCSELKKYQYIVTVCQHILMLDYQQLFIDLGVTHIFWSHAIKRQNFLPKNNNIHIYPFPLFPVQYVKSNKINKSEDIIQKKYLYSFIGAKPNEWYLTNSRDIIIDNLGNDDGGLVIKREQWHYKKVVYDYQILGKIREEQNFLDKKAAEEFKNVMQNSLFGLCPSGSGPNSIRLWESIGFGVIPVVLADTYQHPANSSLWEEATVSCGENLEEILALPTRLAKMAKDKKLIQRKKAALSQLWLQYGTNCFIYDIINLFKDFLKKQTVDKLSDEDATSDSKWTKQELSEENELLLLQLHQVQEELEHYFLRCQELENSINDNR